MENRLQGTRMQAEGSLVGFRHRPGQARGGLGDSGGVTSHQSLRQFAIVLHEGGGRGRRRVRRSPRMKSKCREISDMKRLENRDATFNSSSVSLMNES